jgi:enamine deaminase RidA (YjgF/YER057c/UK114 family)
VSVADRLEELGIVASATSDNDPGHRSVVVAGEHVLISAQLALEDGAIVHPGRLGDEVTLEQGREAARVAVRNAIGLAAAHLRRLERVRVLRLTGYVAATDDFAQHFDVLDGAADLLRSVFGDENGVGALTAVGVTSLPRRSPVELELTLYRDFTRPSGPRGR